ncbi:uncharacterized protein LOC115024024 [Cottoperca gobio]|uniref:Uncharacterized protein LOC115024024 n=1 Tax=Cottoperca gobio TaxID=56716 RepID=A0A6J2RMN6_COTGO|nr:uncharacterized protein LOC115024024 [Cottoperca gobio]
MACAQASPSETLSLEKQLRCSICLDSFVDPVTTACGHSFCKQCLERNYILNDIVCPLCKELLTKTPKVNIVLRTIVEHVKKTLKEDDDTYTGAPGDVACDICTEKKRKAMKSCLVCLASYCLTHLENHSSTERLKGHKLVEPVENLDERACLKHGRPLELYSKKTECCICVSCLEENQEGVVSTEDEWDKKKVKLEHTKGDLQEKIKKRKTRVDEINTSLKSCKDQLDNDWWEIESVFTAVIATVEEAQAAALKPIKERREVVEKEAKYIKEQLEAEIKTLEKTISELDDISALEDHILFLQKYPSLQVLDNLKDSTEVELDTSLSFGTMRKTTTTMLEQIQQQLDKLTSTELERVAKFTVDVKLDPTTAHRRLVLSDDGKEVKDDGEDQEVDDALERFDLFGSILGLNRLTSGKHFWEVEVTNKSGWDLGVASGDAKRKGKLSLDPENGYWLTVHYENEMYAALTAPPLRLSLKEKPEKVGVFVDYEEGLVSFYDMAAQSHIYSFTECSFSDELLPYFSPHVKQDEKNSAPLIISAVKHCEQDMDIQSTIMSHQVCHCGSGFSSYHGLRIHQGKMGCTPKGMRIPESEQFRFKRSIRTSANFGSSIYIEEPMKSIFSPSRQKDSGPNKSSTPDREQPLLMQMLQMFGTPMIPQVTANETNKSLFETPPQYSTAHQATSNTRRALDFASGAQQPLLMRMLQMFGTPMIPQVTANETNKSCGATVLGIVQQPQIRKQAIRAMEREMEREREREKEWEAQKMRQDKIRDDLQQKIQTREQKMAEVRSSVKDCKGDLDAELLEINNVFSEVMRVVADSRQKALQPLEERRQRVKREGQDLVQKLKREIDKLKKTIDELDKRPDLQVSPLPGLDEFQDWKNVTVDTLFSFGSLRITTSNMMEQIHQELEKLSSVELKRIATFAVDVKLDPSTAHQCLVLSPDGKTVRDGGKNQKIPDAPQRFDMFGSILGLNSLTSGKSYWEVEVTNKTGWDLGVARRNAKRKGKLSVNSDNGYWVTVHYEDKKYAALTVPPVSLPLKEKPQKVGVFVDYEEGLVSFYDVTTQSHIYSFTECLFSDGIFPYFSPHLKQNEKNSHPLIITAVKKQS